MWSGSAVTQNGYNIVNNKDSYASYSFAKRTHTHDFLYLYGDNNSGISTTLDITTNYIDKAYYIYLNNNYLSFNGTNFTNTTVKSNATKWIIDNNRYIYTIIQNGNTYTSLMTAVRFHISKLVRSFLFLRISTFGL